jgi:hypothetical protein
MRAIRTFILRLLIDPEDPHACRGAIQTLAGDEEYPFASETALLTLVRRIAQPDGEGPPCEEIGKSSE